jgi:3-oxoacyl-[acyl-carrier-protein] synthase-3
MNYQLGSSIGPIKRPKPLSKAVRAKLARCRILGLGSHIPEDSLTNARLAAEYGLNEEWIESRTGIKRRSILPNGQDTSDMGAAAARRAISDSGIDPAEITHLLLGSCSPDGLVPNTACTIERKLNLSRLVAFDFNVACSGFLYGLYLSAAILALEPRAKILLVAAEAMSRLCSVNNRDVRVLFGDGAGAAVVGSGAGTGAGLALEDICVTSDGGPGELLTANGGGSRSSFRPGDVVGEDYFLCMQGKEVFRHAVRDMVEAARTLLERNDLCVRDVDLFVPHQANGRIIAAVAEQLDFPLTRVMTTLENTGNTSAASIPMALAEAGRRGMLTPGRRILMTAFGAGFTWGAALIRT